MHVRAGVHVLVVVGRAAHHPQHSDPAGTDESNDQGGGQDQEDELDDVPGRRHRGVERAEREQGRPGTVVLPVDV
jgi:hypothetical protein